MLELKNIYKIFQVTQNRLDDRIALNNINLKIEDGEFVTIIGGNGSGKSTLMNIITGSLFPERGSVILDGKDITNLSESKRAIFFGRVFQDPSAGTASQMSIFENLMISSRRTRRKIC